MREDRRQRRPVLVVERLEHPLDDLARRERLLDEEVLDALVLGAAQQHHVRVLDRAPRAPDLLVVGDDRAGRLVVDDEAEVGLVVAHAQRAGGDHRLEVVGEQPLLDSHPRVGVHLPAVRLGRDAVRGQPLRDELGVALGQRVDDPRPVELRQPRREPRQPIRPPRQIDDLEAQARPPERPPVGLQLARMPDLQLIGHVGHDAIVGRRRRAQHSHPGRQPLEHLGRAAGSPAGSRAPSPRCSAPRRPRAARPARRTAAASCRGTAGCSAAPG